MKTARHTPPTAVLLCALALVGGSLTACGNGEGTPAAPATPSAAAPHEPAGAKGSPAAKPGAAKGAKSGASAQLAYQTGLQLLLKGDPEKALAELSRAVELDPTMSEAFFELGKLQVHLSSQNIGSQARDLDILDQGLAALEKARDLEPQNDVYWYWVGRVHGLKNDSEKALASLEKAVELNPKNAAAWKKLGLIQKDAAQIEAARASFEKAIENDPAEAGAYFQLGQTLEALRDLPAARAAYEKSIQLDPTEPDVFGRLTQVCAMLGDPECEQNAQAAMESWREYDQKLMRRRRAVNLDPGDAAALRRLGEMYFQVGKWEEALEWFVKAIHIDPKDALSHLYCGVTRRHLKDYVNATNHLKEAEFLAPDNLDPKLELLRLYAESEDAASFTELLTKTEEEASQHGPSLFALGEVCRETGREDDATRLFDEAKALGVTDATPVEPEPAEEE